MFFFWGGWDEEERRWGQEKSYSQKKKTTIVGPKPKASPKCALLQKRRGGPLAAKESLNCLALGNYRRKKRTCLSLTQCPFGGGDLAQCKVGLF